MDLSRALALQAHDSLAFVGAGGKTSAMFALAMDWDSPIVLTTTTHLGTWQAGLAEKHHIVQPGEAVEQLVFDQAQILLITGPSNNEDRLIGLDEKSLESLRALCINRHIPLLIEADGARQRPLKAPADYEPVLPNWVNKVVVMAGLTGLGKALTTDAVHRPEQFSAVSELQLGNLIRVEDVVSVLSSEQGGLKGIPKGAHRFAFLTQANDAKLQAKGQRIAHLLRDQFDTVLIGSLGQPGISGPIFSAHAKSAGIILAAGGSQRLGRSKQLLEWQGKPFIRIVVQNALEAGLTPLIVVTGADHDLVAAAVDDLPVVCIHNPEWAQGQSTSMQAGLRALPDKWDSAMFLLSDQPHISTLLIRQILEKYAEKRAPITAPMIRGQRGNPVLFARETFNALMQVQGDQGGRAVFNEFKVDWVPWIDDRLLLDVDRGGDEQRLFEAFYRH